MRRLLPLMLVLLAAPDLRAAVDVRVSAGRVDVQANNAPLSEILDGLARQLNIKIVYEGPPPKQLLTVDLKDRTPAEAFLAIVEGQGLAYAFTHDKSGTRVETLLMAGGNNAPSSSSSLPPPPPERRAREAVREAAQDPLMEEPQQEEPFADEDDALTPDAGRPKQPQAKPSEPPPPPAQGVFLPAPGTGDFPTSTFAPRPPAPEQPKQPKAEATPPPFNP